MILLKYLTRQEKPIPIPARNQVEEANIVVAMVLEWKMVQRVL